MFFLLNLFKNLTTRLRLFEWNISFSPHENICTIALNIHYFYTSHHVKIQTNILYFIYDEYSFQISGDSLTSKIAK